MTDQTTPDTFPADQQPQQPQPAPPAPAPATDTSEQPPAPDTTPAPEAHDAAPAVQPGQLVTWQGPDGITRHGLVLELDNGHHAFVAGFDPVVIPLDQLS